MAKGNWKMQVDMKEVRRIVHARSNALLGKSYPVMLPIYSLERLLQVLFEDRIEYLFEAEYCTDSRKDTKAAATRKVIEIITKELNEAGEDGEKIAHRAYKVAKDKIEQRQGCEVPFKYK